MEGIQEFFGICLGQVSSLCMILVLFLMSIAAKLVQYTIIFNVTCTYTNELFKIIISFNIHVI